MNMQTLHASSARDATPPDPTFWPSERYAHFLEQARRKGRGAEARGPRWTILTGFGGIAFLTVLFSALTIVQVAPLGSAPEALFAANYRSIQYMRGIERAATESTVPGGRIDSLAGVMQAYITEEFANITEPGEREAATRLERECRDLTTAAHAGIDAGRRRDAVIGTIDTIVALNERGMFARVDDSKERAASVRDTTIVLGVLLLTGCVLLAVGVSRRSMHEFKAVDRAKSAFVATAAYELRRPLESISACADLLHSGAAGGVTPQQQELLQRIRAHDERLLLLVRELLDLSRMESGVLSIERSNVVVPNILAGAEKIVAPLAAQSDVRVERRIASGLVPVRADASKLTWALAGILTHAVRRSPRGATVSMSVWSAEEHVWIAVADHGAHLVPAALDRLFDSTMTPSWDAAGTGDPFGLSIAREIIRAHGGHIWGASEGEEGLAVTFVLPVAAS